MIAACRDMVWRSHQRARLERDQDNIMNPLVS
jgi:hypothetical protein